MLRSDSSIKLKIVQKYETLVVGLTVETPQQEKEILKSNSPLHYKTFKHSHLFTKVGK